jgi:hypothetical protein
MQQIADSLEKLGMSEYTQRFAENGISVAALRHLTDQDLKDMGVLLRHRRIMLAAIQEFADDSSVAAKTATTGDAKVQDAAERSTRAMAYLCISAIRRPTRTMPNERCERR